MTNRDNNNLTNFCNERLWFIELSKHQFSHSKTQHMIAQDARLSVSADERCVCQLSGAAVLCFILLQAAYSQSNQTSRDTSFPAVILGPYNQGDDDICSGSRTLGSV